MKVTLRTKVLGTEDRVNKEGQPYTMIGFLDGINASKCKIDERCVYPPVVPFKEYDITLDIVVAFNTRVAVVAIEEV